MLAENEAAFRRLALGPRVLRGKEVRDFGFPVLVSSMASTVPIADVVAAATGPVWFQLYLQPDFDVTEALVRRAELAGCAALLITVDSPVFGRHRRDIQHDFHDLPAGIAAENMRDLAGTPGLRKIEMGAFSWDDVERICAMTPLPVWLKGVLHPTDAGIAAEHGLGIFVSNHGGRQLDLVPAALDALPAVVDAVAGRIPVVLDGGVRSGGDVALALALGASAAGVGRPVLWGLAADGSALSEAEQVHYLQGTYFNTAVVQMSEAMAHLLLALAQHPEVVKRVDDDRYFAHTLDETFRLYPLFGIAHRITTADIELDEHTRFPAGSVLCFDYPAYHASGYAHPDDGTTPRPATSTTFRSASPPTAPARHGGSPRS